MTKVLYCDRCGKEIEKERHFEAEFHSFQVGDTLPPEGKKAWV